MSVARAVPLMARLGVRSAPRRRLFCMPYAGGGVAPFRLWFRSLPADIEVSAAQLPGREGRIAEAPPSSIAAAVAAMIPALEAQSDLPYAIFGHSMGALLAYELTLALEQRGGRPPDHLFVSGRRPPHVIDPRPPLHALPEPEFLDQLQRRYGAIPAPVLAEADLLALLLPVVRADIRNVELYPVRETAPRIRCPVTVYGGSADLHPTPDELLLWQGVAAHPLEHRVFDGDHFYLNVQREALTADIAARWGDGDDHRARE